MGEKRVSSNGEIDFHHPYEPYEIQKDFMLALYNCIEQGKVGIFESPTGTGKSLSLLCGSITWLREHKRAAYDSQVAPGEADDEPDWMREHSHKAAKQVILQRRNDLEARLEAIRQKESRVRRRQGQDHPAKRQKTDNQTPEGETAFLLDEYDSDEASSTTATATRTQDDLSEETKALLGRLGFKKASDKDTDEEDSVESKIFISSRTHSQLSQLVAELHKVSFPSALPSDEVSDRPLVYPAEQVKQLSLGSRKNLCVNDKVLSLGSTSQINERCLELQESKVPASQRCKHLPSKDNEATALDFKYHALSKIRDIEDLATLGSKTGICPYYAARPAINPAEIVTLPYPLLLQESAREALSLSVKDQVVIIDEAHNLMDAILGIYTTEISLSQLDLAREQVMSYLQKFRHRLAGKNRVYVAQVVRLLDSLIGFLTSLDGTDTSGIADSSSLLSGQGVDQINLYKLMHYLQESKLARKVHGYVVQQQKESYAGTLSSLSRSPEHREQVQSPVLNVFQSFILALTNPAKEGRFFWSKDGSGISRKLKYLLLDPSEHFREIVESARSVVLAGGTMSPMSDYATQLFPFLDSSRLTTLSCSHVIPRSNLLVNTLSTGIADASFYFTFAARNNPVRLQNLGSIILRLLPLIPDGIVIFFPSYSYLEAILSAWQIVTPIARPLLSRMRHRKPVFIDSQSAPTESILRSYTDAITQDPSGRGAVLLSVIGGKLSEGINFSDRLGRCVIVVGMPYPNPYAAEWKARMEFVEERAKAASASKGEKYVPGEASRDFADNTCMRAVNQAIGRAIRHKDDWASILLVDKRYERARIRERLPGWMKGSLVSGGTDLASVEKSMRDFYARKKLEEEEGKKD